MNDNFKDNSIAYKFLESSFDLVRDACSILEKCFGITFFSYVKVYPNGEYLTLSNNLNWSKFYFENIHSEQIIWENEVHLGVLSKYDRRIPVLWPDKPNSFIMESLIEHNIWNGMHFTYYTKEFSEFWAFAGENQNEGLKRLYLSKLNTLNKFIIYFNERINNHIKSKKEPLAIHKNGVNYPKEWPIYQDIREITFLKEMGVLDKRLNLSMLTQRELECLYYLEKGQTIKQIARSLGLSNRTVETYYNRVKIKTGYNLRSELIKLFQDNFL